VLFTFEQAIAILVPADPGILQCFFGLWPEGLEEIEIARNLPVTIKVNNSPQLAVSGWFKIPVFVTGWQAGTEIIEPSGLTLTKKSV